MTRPWSIRRYLVVAAACFVVPLWCAIVALSYQYYGGDIAVAEPPSATVARALFWGALASIVLTVLGCVMLERLARSVLGLKNSAQSLARGEIVTASPVLVADLAGAALAMAATSRSLADERLLFSRANEQLSRFATVFESAGEGIIVTDPEGTILDVNNAFLAITGYRREDVIGNNPRLLRSGRQGKDFYAEMWGRLLQREIWNRRKSGEVYPELLNIASIPDQHGNIAGYVGIFTDLTTIKRYEKQMERVAHYDALTGIPNRALLADRMKQAIAQTERTGAMLAVCYLDLDGFKAINDDFGHDVGDNVLVEVATRIGMTIRAGDTVARLGGDEFVVLLLGLSPGEDCAASLYRLLKAITEPVVVFDQEFLVTASVGVTFCDSTEDDPDTLLRQADQAMYAAKQDGKNRFHVYDPSQDRLAKEFNEITIRIRDGLDRDEFVLFFQPKVDLKSHKVIGAEALIRWNHPERGLLLPGEFLPIIQNSELETYLGKWVIDTTLGYLDQWHKEGLELIVSINIAAYHLQSKEFIVDLTERLEGYPDLPLGSLQIEILETAALNDLKKVTEVIEGCRKIGIGFALDDFGTGYSSLTYLRYLPTDTIKIDQTFVRDMLQDSGNEAIVTGIIALARAFGREIVAEGVENHELAKVLRNMGCQVAQGYGIAMPMSAEKLREWLLNPPDNVAGIDPDKETSLVI